MSEDEIRIKLLEYVGWTGLTRKGRLVEGAMRGYDPADGKFKLAPNPVKSLDSMAIVESFAAAKINDYIFRRYIGIIRNINHARYESQVMPAGDRAKSFFYILQEDDRLSNQCR